MVSLLPVDLLALPVMLILLATMPIGYAVSALCILLIPILWMMHHEGTLEVRVPGLMRLGALALAFTISSAFVSSCSCCRLTSQMLWLGWFAIGHIIYYMYKRWHGVKLIGYEEAVCCCTARRRQTLIEAYIRFDRQLLIWTLIVLAVMLPIIYFVHLSDFVKSVITMVIAFGAWMVIVIELLQLSWIRRKLSEEHWIPTISETGEVVGRVAETCATDVAEGRLPIVRLMAFTDGMIYLERGQGIVETETIHLDTPFRSWLYEGTLPIEVAQQMIDQRFCGVRRARPRQLLRYHTEEGGQELLVYLFAVEIESPDLLQIDCQPIEGKWWSTDLLKLQLEHSEFSPYLCAELPLMEQTVLLAQRIKRAHARREHSSSESNGLKPNEQE